MRLQMSEKYYVDVDEDLAARLKKVDDEHIYAALEDVADEHAPPADEVMYEELSAAERKRREIRRMRRHGASKRLPRDS